MKPSTHSEAAFETVCEAYLLANGYAKVESKYDAQKAIFPEEVIAFIRATQPKEWAKLEALHTAQKQRANTKMTVT